MAKFKINTDKIEKQIEARIRAEAKRLGKFMVRDATKDFETALQAHFDENIDKILDEAFKDA